MRSSYAAAAAALLACTALVAPAIAADRPLLVKAKPLPAPASWTQFYVGGGIGLNLETGSTTVSVLGDPSDSVSLNGLQGASLGLTATAGADYQFSHLFVVGAFADYDWSSQNPKIAGSDAFGSVTLTPAHLDGGWTVGGRAGVLVAPNVLVYGLGGFTQMRMENWSETATGLGGSQLLQEPTQTLSGYTVGGGIEYRLTNNVSLRGEYRYVKLGTATTVDTTNFDVWTTDLNVHIARVLAAYRFGGAGPMAPVTGATGTPAATWTGFYGGLGLGGDAISTHLLTQIDIPLPTQISGDGLGGGNATGTAVVGFDYRLQSWVAGVFGLFDLGTNGNARVSVSESFGGDVISADVASVDKSWTAGGRLGYLIAPDALVYGLAGYTSASSHPITYTLAGVTATATPPDFHGITVGGGFEKLITNAIAARLEYRNTRFDTMTYAPPLFTSVQAQPTINSVRVLMAYRLGTMQ